MSAINTTTIIKKMLQDSLEREQQIQKNKEEAVQEFNRRFPIGTLVRTNHITSSLSISEYGYVLDMARPTSVKDGPLVYFRCLLFKFEPTFHMKNEQKTYGNGYTVERVLEGEMLSALTNKFQNVIREDEEKLRETKSKLKKDKKFLKDFQKSFEKTIALAKEKFEQEKYNEYGKDYGNTDAT